MFVPAMTMYRVYEGFHGVLDLVSNILYSLWKKSPKMTVFKLQLQDNKV